MDDLGRLVGTVADLKVLLCASVITNCSIGVRGPPISIARSTHSLSRAA
jgi:hypothetical protein